ncbi:hypothetical protein ACFSVK_09870 [Azorhizophilus paspali]|uniref:hypothetical protein n=1 Tax=Azorhizophilus paspali TaxID=69963 RepID=UPI003642FE2B
MIKVKKITRAWEGDRWRPLCYALAATLLVIGLRAKGLPGVENTLWAEDGSIFLNQALSLGIGSIFEPYAGYLHLWPRLFAFLASVLGLASAPLVMFMGWVLGYFLMASLVVTRLHAQGVSLPFCFLGVILVGLQPSTSETFFNVTNAQWYLSIALTFLLLLNGGAKSIGECCLVFVLSLTGPFSIILAPLVFFRIALKRFKVDMLPHAIFFCCVLVQIYFLIGSGRGEGIQADRDLYSWFGALNIFLFFGGERFWFPVIFWCFGVSGVVFLLEDILQSVKI